MKTLNEHYEDRIVESSLSRVWKHNEEHDCGAMTAFRVAPNCGEGTPYTSKENKARNKSLLAKLKSIGYGVTKLHGVYPEGGETKKEESFFIVDLQDAGKLEQHLKEFGDMFDQDSVLIVPKGAIKGDAKAYLLGTNKCKNNWLGYGKKEPFAKGKLGVESPIYTSKVNGRPFIFETVSNDVLNAGNGFGVWAMHLIAEKDWTELVED